MRSGICGRVRALVLFVRGHRTGLRSSTWRYSSHGTRGIDSLMPTEELGELPARYGCCPGKPPRRCHADLAVVLAATVLCYVALYGPQPRLPCFRERHALTTAGAGVVVTIAMLPLTVGPLLAGRLLSVLNPRRLMGAALLLLSGAITAFVPAER